MIGLTTFFACMGGLEILHAAFSFIFLQQGIGFCRKVVLQKANQETISIYSTYSQGIMKKYIIATQKY